MKAEVQVRVQLVLLASLRLAQLLLGLQRQLLVPGRMAKAELVLVLGALRVATE